MKYWKQGFYDKPLYGAVEIKDNYYNELLVGQTEGKNIIENENGIPVLVEYQYKVSELKKMKVIEIENYDKSEAIDSFTLNNTSIWFDKAMRVGLMNSLNIEKQDGKSETYLWYKGELLVLSIEEIIEILRQVELYALTCYNVTQHHIANINRLTTKEAIEMYDFKAGYPEKLIFKTT